jgi:DNA invertase Pin-like site-specific DNA recombinase
MPDNTAAWLRRVRDACAGLHAATQRRDATIRNAHAAGASAAAIARASGMARHTIARILRDTPSE